MIESESNLRSAKGAVERCRWRGLLWVLALAIVARVAFGFEHRTQLEYAWPTVDAKYHDAWARTLAGLPSGLAPGQGDAVVFAGPSLRPIGYPAWLALGYRLTGGSIEVALWVQHLLGVGAAVLLWWTLAARVGALAATLASSLFAVHFAPLYFEGELHATSLLIVLDLLGIAWYLRALEQGRIRWAVASGLVFGAAVLVRPNVLLPALLLIAAVLVLRKGAELRERWRLAGGLALGLFVGMSPGAVYNARATGEFLPLTATAGINLYLGQGPNATGLIDSELGDLGSFRTCFDYLDVKAHVESKLGRTLTYGELDRWFSGQAWQSMRADPGRALGLLGTKAALLLSGEEIGHNKEVALEVRHSKVLRSLPMPFAVVLGLLLFGVLAHFAAGRLAREDSQAKERSSASLVFWVQCLWIAGFAASLLPYFAASRYRVPLLPHLLAVGAIGAASLLQSRERWRLAGFLALVSLLFAFGLTRLGTRYQGPFAYKWHLDRGMTAAERLQLDVAATELAAAQALAPENASVRTEIATLALRQEDFDRAEKEFQAVLGLDPFQAKALYNLGWLAERRGAFRSALEYYRRAALSAPTQALPNTAHALLIRRLVTDPREAQRDGTVALQAMQAWLQPRTPSASEWELLAACQAEVGDFEGARASIGRALANLTSKDRESALQRRLESERALYDQGKPLRIAPRRE